MTGRDYIIINGVSSHDYGLYVDTPPMPIYQAPLYESVNIFGKAEGMTFNDTAREDVQIDINAYLFDDEQSAEPNELYAFLSGAKTLQTSKSSSFEYRVKRLLSIVPAYQGHGKQLLTISFICSPYRYSIENDVYVSENEEVWLNNDGTMYCQPVYKLYGNGTLELKVNEDTENKMVINNVSDFVVVDSERFVCYKGNEIKRCKGQFPFFNIGMNRIETNATKIEITLNKRWL